MENQQLEKLMYKLRQIVSQIQVQKYNQSQLNKEYASSTDYLQLIELVCPLLIHNTSISDKSSVGKRLPSVANGFSNNTAITVNNNYNCSQPLGFMAGNKIQQWILACFLIIKIAKIKYFIFLSVLCLHMFNCCNKYL